MSKRRSDVQDEKRRNQDSPRHDIPRASPSTSGSDGRPRLRASHADAGRTAATPSHVHAHASSSKKAPAARGSSRSRAAARPGTTPRKTPLAPPKRATQGQSTRSGQAGRAGAAMPDYVVEPSPESRDLALSLAAAGLDKKAMGIEILEVAGKVDYADFLVIMTGRSDRHVQAIATGLEDALRQKKIRPLSVEGLSSATWVLLDFGDVVVHVFQEDMRQVYDIEGLWVDAARLDVPGSEEPGGLEIRDRDSRPHAE